MLIRRIDDLNQLNLGPYKENKSCEPFRSTE